MTFENSNNSLSAPTHKKERLYRQIILDKSPIVVENGFYSIKQLLGSSEHLSNHEQKDMSDIIQVMQPHLEKIIRFFED